MQKVIRRTLLAERQAKRRLQRKQETLVRLTRKSATENDRFKRRDEIADIKTARAERREDYELGPLAPRRDVGISKDSYGTLSQIRMQFKKLSMEERLQINPTGGRYANIVVGDRVVLLDGRDKGKIGKVREMDVEKQTLVVEGLNMVDVQIPKYMLKTELDKRPLRSMEMPILVDKVRLVVPLPDPETKALRDVIVKKIVNTPVFHDKVAGRRSWSRIIPGLNVVIPWPKAEPKMEKDHECDTLRIDVETQTFVPRLLRPPMPSTVIDELRNKFSVFRTRHDEDYIAAKMAEDDSSREKRQAEKEMRTPMKEVNALRRKMRKIKGYGKLSQEALARIGNLIASKQAALKGKERSTVAIEV